MPPGNSVFKTLLGHREEWFAASFSHMPASSAQLGLKSQKISNPEVNMGYIPKGNSMASWVPTPPGGRLELGWGCTNRPVVVQQCQALS